MTHTPRLGSVRCLRPGGFRRMAYTEWGDPANPRVVICVHGLTRNGRDFDVLAAALSKSHRVLCPDVLGRGLSDWLPTPEGYANPAYAADLVTLLARTGVESVDWVGTSMGGLIGMILASLPEPPITRMVLNDVGAVVPLASLQRIGAYLGQDPSFADLAALEQGLRQTHASFGPLTDAEWRHLAEHSARSKTDGTLGYAYDPAIKAAFAALPEADVELWPLWEAIKLPVLVIRGAESDLLLPEVVEGMRRRGPGCTVAEIAGAGHAPALMAADQVKLVIDWLNP